VDLAISGPQQIGEGADTLIGIENLTGSASADTLKGDDGSNYVRGSGGNDTLSGAGNRDVIIDFQKGSDDIDVSGIDPNAARGGDQSFRFIGMQDFRGREGELRYQTFDQAGASNDITVIGGDINGDRVADFEIEIVGILQFTSGDFLL
jgi:serralysin